MITIIEQKSLQTPDSTEDQMILQEAEYGNMYPPETVQPDEHVMAAIRRQDPSILSEFIAESRDHCHAAESLFLELESDTSNAEHLNGIFRAFHTIKGSAGFLELSDIRTLTHAAESLLDKARSLGVTLHAGHIDLLLETCDTIKFMLGGTEDALGGGMYCRAPDFDRILARLKEALTNDNNRVAVPEGTVKKLGEILIKQKVVTPNEVEECLSRQAEGDGRKLGEILIAEKGVAPLEVASAIASQNTARSPAKTDDTIRVAVDKLDQVIDIIGEALITQSMINANPVVRNSNDQELAKTMTQMNSIMRQAQEFTMSMRMVKIKPTFQKMARLARDLARECGKNIEFATTGEETEIDKSAVELIADPLMHMVRNAVDHGIEAAEEDRVAHGKPAQAHIFLSAYHRSGNVCIEIVDDGKGLDAQTILQKAIEKNIARPEIIYSEKEIFNFIFLPGFSTATTITNVSGRGVGMDVVRRNIQALRGTIDIQSQPGQGTTFILRLPLTLAIITGMIVRTGTEHYIIPTLSVVETLRPSREMISTVAGRGKVLAIRDHLIRLCNLTEILTGECRGRAAENPIAIVVEDTSGRRVALLVDEIIDQQQVVIKSIGGGFDSLQGVSGAAIMSDGKVNLILDMGSVLLMAGE